MSRKKTPQDDSININANPFDKIKIQGKKLTEKQKVFLNLSTEDTTKIMFVSGPAGSTKTYMAVMSALRHLQKDNSLDLLYVRTAIESADKGLGALPGTIEEKFNPYMAPLEDKLQELLPSSSTIKTDLLKSGRVQAMPINYLRGANWTNKIVVADESQNFTFRELVTMITRIGENSKLFICGDSMQSDINGKSGFTPMVNLFNDEESKEKGIHTFWFNESDILRSEILKYIITKLKEHHKTQKAV
jgi:phosphate starvation-inducible PhoH-like protein